MALNEYEKALKDEVLTIAGDDPKMVEPAVKKVLARHAEHERGRYGYLLRTLVKAATARIRAIRNKYDRRGLCA